MNIILAIGFSFVYLFFCYLRVGRYKVPDDATYYQKMLSADETYRFFRTSSICTGIIAVLFIFASFSGNIDSMEDANIMTIALSIAIPGEIINIIFAVVYHNKMEEYSILHRQESEKNNK